MKLKKLFAAAIFTALTFSSSMALAAGLKPFILGSIASGSLDQALADTKASVQGEGFEVVGEYQPNESTRILVVTHSELKKLASLSDNGGFGSVERIALVNKGGQIEISYTNPEYQWNAYRMKGDIQPIQGALERLLGVQKQFGSDEGLEAGELREYHYKFAMPYFDEVDELAEYDSYQQAVSVIEKGLSQSKGGVNKVYRIDLPGEEASLFGVAFTQDAAADANVLKQIDHDVHSHAAHLCYEVLVTGNKAIALNGKFRIAISWPSLSMMGENSFMSISSVPGQITDALEKVARP